MAHRYRLYPSPAQLPVLRAHCGQARWVWNEALRAVKAHASDATVPFFDLTKARRETDWLAAGSSSVQQQAVRDLARALVNAKAGTHRFPRWRRKGEDEGFCVRDVTVAILNRRWAELTVPKAGRVRFRLSRPLPRTYGMGWLGSRSTRRAGGTSLSLLRSHPCSESQRGPWSVSTAASPRPSPPPTAGLLGPRSSDRVSADGSSGSSSSSPGSTRARVVGGGPRRPSLAPTHTPSGDATTGSSGARPSSYVPTTSSPSRTSR